MQCDGLVIIMKTLQKIPDFKNDEEISAFMETHDGFELVDQGLAEIVETAGWFQKGQSYVELDPETLQLLDELVTAGFAPIPQTPLRKPSTAMSWPYCRIRINWFGNDNLCSMNQLLTQLRFLKPCRIS